MLAPLLVSLLLLLATPAIASNHTSAASEAQRAVESQCLQDLAKSAGSNHWVHPWNSVFSPPFNDKPCSLHGITCNADDHVMFIDLANENLHGTINDCVFTAFKNMTHLKLRNNHLDGSLPDVVDLPSLKWLDLSWNQIHGEVTPLLSLAPTLEYLNVGVNSFTGHLFSLETFSHLTHLLANFNGRPLDALQPGLTGALPTASYPSSLIYMDLSQNTMIGGIPEAIGRIPKLQYLKLSLNKFSNELPSSFVQLQDLYFLDLSGNAFTGSFPEMTVVGMQHFDISQNLFEGSFPPFLTQAPSLQTISLGENSFQGPLPLEFRSTTIETFQVGVNQFSGPIPPSYGTWTNLRALDLSSNDLDGQLPATILAMSSIHTALVGSNYLSGPLPSHYGFFLQELDISDNLFTEMPDVVSAASLMIFRFADNPWSSTQVPGGICMLPSLQEAVNILGNCTKDIACQAGFHGNVFGQPFAGINSCIPCVTDEAWYALDFTPDVACQPHIAQSACPDACLPSNRPHNAVAHVPTPSPTRGPGREAKMGPLEVVGVAAGAAVGIVFAVSLGFMMLLHRKKMRDREAPPLLKVGTNGSFTQSPFPHNEYDRKPFPNHDVDSRSQSPYRDQPPYRDADGRQQPPAQSSSAAATKETELAEIVLTGEAIALDIKRSGSGGGEWA
jgi:Leucine-rich repeat (LRR) protein